MGYPLAGKFAKRCPDCLRAAGNLQMIDQTNRVFNLRLKQAHEIAVTHWRQGMVAHGAFSQRQPPDKQVAHIDRASVLRKCRTVNGLVGSKLRHQRLGHRPDISVRGGIESRTIFPENAAGTRCLEPGECCKALRHCL